MAVLLVIRRWSMKKKRLRLKKWVIFVGIFIIIGGLIFIFFKKDQKVEEPVSMDKTNEIEEVVIDEFEKNKEINPEYMGEISFDGGLIEEPLVQTSDNEKYLNYAWDLTQSSRGSAFIDYRNSLDDQNIIIYGHYVYDDESLMFSPLHNLVNQENYENNKYITLKLENEIRHYVVTYVYYYEMDSSTLKYYEPNYDLDFFNTYISAVEQQQFYDTGETLNYDDHWLTLQTCVRNRDDLRLIVLAKEIES